MTTVYKVVRNTGYDYRSAFPRYYVGTRGGYGVEHELLLYSEDYITTPEMGKIFAFKTSKDAKGFCIMPGLRGWEVWQAETSDSTDYSSVPIPMDGLGDDAHDRFVRYWDDPEKFILSHPPTDFMMTPPGTVLCDDLQLTQRIDGGEQ